MDGMAPTFLLSPRPCEDGTVTNDRRRNAAAAAQREPQTSLVNQAQIHFCCCENTERTVLFLPSVSSTFKCIFRNNNKY